MLSDNKIEFRKATHIFIYLVIFIYLFIYFLFFIFFLFYFFFFFGGGVSRTDRTKKVMNENYLKQS